MPKIGFKDISIHYSVRGKGPAVVLLHGFLEASWMWSDLAKQISTRNKVVCIDLPGHGNSDCIGYVHTMDEMAEAVSAVLKKLKLRRVHMIGHSMGGYVALAFAEFNPDSVKSLTLYQSTARADDNQRKKDRNRAISLVKQNAKSFVNQSIPLLFRPVNRKRFRTDVSEVKKLALQTPVQGIIAAIGGMRDRPNRELLLKFPPYPVHILASDKDPRIPLQESIELSEISEHVTMHLIKGSGHMSYIEAPQETLRVLKGIISS